MRESDRVILLFRYSIFLCDEWKTVACMFKHVPDPNCWNSLRFSSISNTKVRVRVEFEFDSKLKRAKLLCWLWKAFLTLANARYGSEWKRRHEIHTILKYTKKFNWTRTQLAVKFLDRDQSQTEFDRLESGFRIRTRVWIWYMSKRYMSLDFKWTIDVDNQNRSTIGRYGSGLIREQSLKNQKRQSKNRWTFSHSYAGLSNPADHWWLLIYSTI